MPEELNDSTLQCVRTSSEGGSTNSRVFSHLKSTKNTILSHNEPQKIATGAIIVAWDWEFNALLVTCYADKSCSNS